ncbi:MAG: UDP-3-O-[3-hydroxymyristoyl] N-acetylglucosamine deacetylase [Candidatus Omnitrophica bacterium]|nr:UDP-3-O-[3-hydroxymyristoyl] N-acetylglucosamine deacetylase [Candidatus Omnitrophota bacterium]
MERQRTIEKEIQFSGRGLQTGARSTVKCIPLEADAGICFRRIDCEDSPAICLKDSHASAAHGRRTVLGSGRTRVQTVEHLLAALWALGIDNIMVEIDSKELPALDGSALGFFKHLKEAGLRELPEARQVIKILEAEHIEENGRKLSIYPNDVFRISYLIDYNIASIGREEFDIILDQDSFVKEIAPARTFCLKREAFFLRILGLGRGATTDNTLIMGNKGPFRTNLRFPDEPVRHKILDLIGDLYVLGVPVIGRIVAEKSGHDLNAKLAEKLYKKYVSKL